MLLCLQWFSSCSCLLFLPRHLRILLLCLLGVLFFVFLQFFFVFFFFVIIMVIIQCALRLILIICLRSFLIRMIPRFLHIRICLLLHPRTYLGLLLSPRVLLIVMFPLLHALRFRVLVSI